MSELAPKRPPGRPRASSGARVAVLSIKISAEDRALLERACAVEGRALSTSVRDAAIEWARRVLREV